MTRFLVFCAVLFLAFPSLADEGHMMMEGMAMPQAAPSLTASADLQGALKAGQGNFITLTLKDAAGKPVAFRDLQEVHTKKIHLLVVDQSLTDYQHIHPAPVPDGDGLYAFTFTPLTAHDYKVWVDVTPVGGSQQMIPVVLKGADPCPSSCVTPENRLTAQADGMTFSLDLQGHGAMLYITDASGQPVKNLEPVMGTYAHMVGFTGDGAAVAHMHPLMAHEPETDSARGSSPLSFMLMAPTTDFLKVYIQVKVNGKEIFVPMGIVTAN